MHYLLIEPAGNAGMSESPIILAFADFGAESLIFPLRPMPGGHEAMAIARRIAAKDARSAETPGKP
jgi:hypothetical protein